MSIISKIEEIRRKPEHIRIRYVWGCVAVSMLIIFSIWLFSLSALFQSNKDATSTSGNSIDDLKNQLQNIQQQASSTKNAGAQQTAAQEGVNNNAQQQSSTDFQYPANPSADVANIGNTVSDSNSSSTNQDASPQSSTYSTLPSAQNSSQQ